jgi:hypothetical protein
MWGAGTVRPRRLQNNHHRHHSPLPQRRWLALWGFALWAFLAAAYWTFHWEVLEPRSTWLVVKQGLLWPYTLDEDATWAAFTHFIGFAIFVFLADGRKRWILITGVVAFSFYWLLLLLQVPTRLWSTWTNVLGFAVMLVSSIVGLGLFSALAQALALLRTLVGAHPELKRELERELEGHPLLMIAVSGCDGGYHCVACPALIGPGACDDGDCEKCFLCGAPARPDASVAVCAAWRQDSATGKMLACKPYAEMRDKLRAVEARKRELEAAEEQGKQRIHEMQEQHAQRQARADDEIRWLTGLLHKHLPAEKLQRFASRVPPVHAAQDIAAPLGTAETPASPRVQDAIRRDPAPSHLQLQRQVDLLADMLVQSRMGGSTGGKREVKQLVDRLAAAYEQVASLHEENARLCEAMSQQAVRDAAVRACAPAVAVSSFLPPAVATVGTADLSAAVPGAGCEHGAVGAQEVPGCHDVGCASDAAREGSAWGYLDMQSRVAGGGEVGASSKWLSPPAAWGGHACFSGGLFMPPSWAGVDGSEEGGGRRMPGERSEARSEAPDALQPKSSFEAPSDLPFAPSSGQEGGEGDEGLERIERWCDALVYCD